MRTGLQEEHDRKGAITWRCERLVESSFPLPLAAALARDSRFDLHALIELTERGCPPQLAVRILAPLEDGGDAA
jgi:hypothetical protein